MWVTRFAAGAGVGLLLLNAGCAAPTRAPDLGDLYNRSAQYHSPDRNPVIVIPGILGSRLVDSNTGQVVWGAFGGGAVNPATPEGARLCALPMRQGAPLEELTDSVRSNGALDRLKVSLLGLPVELGAYVNILNTLGVGGYRDEQLARAGVVDYGNDHFTCFQFDYDWRRSNVENARRFHQFLMTRRDYVRAELHKRFGVENADVKFDIVAHSMGGLIARYFARYGDQPLPDDGSLPDLNWAGAEYISRVIMVGAPNAGAAKALDQLVNGLRIPAIAAYHPAILDTMPAIYEMLPRSRHDPVVDARNGQALDVYDPKLWEEMRWGLAAPGNDKELRLLLPDVHDARTRREIALDHLRKNLRRARQFHQALDRPAQPPPGLDFYLVAGDAVPTLSTIHVDTRTGRFVRSDTAPGDGTVIRQSALMDERRGQTWQPMLESPIRWTDVLFLFSSHLGMTKDPAFSDNVLYLLLEDPRS